MQRIVLSCAALALLGFAAAASGAPIIYNEAIDGDLPNQGTPLNTDPLHTFVFDLGTNTISGTISGGGDPSDHDSFAFVIPAGMQLAAGSVSGIDLPGSANMNWAIWNIRSGDARYNLGTFVDEMRVDFPGTETLLGVPLGADTYNASFGGLSLSGSPPANAGYTFEFTVVPEPTSLSILALATMVLLRHNRRSR